MVLTLLFPFLIHFEFSLYLVRGGSWTAFSADGDLLRKSSLMRGLGSLSKGHTAADINAFASQPSSL